MNGGFSKEAIVMMSIFGTLAGVAFLNGSFLGGVALAAIALWVANADRKERGG